MYGMILSYILFGMSVVTGVLAFHMIRVDKKEWQNKCIAMILLASSVWSFCYSAAFVQTNTEIARICRAIGQYGVFAFLALVVFMASHWVTMPGWTKKAMYAFVTLSLPLAYITGTKECVTFFYLDDGMYYQLNKSFWNDIYTVYCVLICVCLYVMVWKMIRHAKRKKERAMGRIIFACVNVTVIGMVFDTIMPQYGFYAFPGSTLGQFFGAILVYRTVLFFNKSQLNIANMSEFIYYNIKEPLLVYDSDKRLCVVNETAKDFFALPVQYEEMTLEKLFEAGDASFYNEYEQTEVEAVCSENQAYCSVSTVPIWDEYKELIGYLVLVNNLTEKMQMIHELEQERKRADAANIAKSNVLAQISHEIRTPINAVLGMDEMIIRESVSPEIKQYAEDIKGAGRTLLNLVNEILDFSKMESGRMDIVKKQYNLLDAVIDIRNVLTPKAEEKGLSFRIELDEGLPYELYGDEMRVKQIMMNLISNAIKYTKEGFVCLKLKCRKKDAKRMQLIIQVQDSGIGIKEEYIKGLFDAFVRVDEKKNYGIEGTGLGLSIVRQLAELMNGSVRVESELGKGSMFEAAVEQEMLSDKRVKGADALLKWEQSRREKKVESVRFSAEQARVLVVDDTAINLTVVKALLKRIKIQVDTAASGAECIEKATRSTYHIILLDHMMPEMDGIETLKRLKETEDNASKEAVLIVLTANAIVGAKEMFLENGFDDYISKPIDGEKLENMLEKYLPSELIHYL